MVNNNPKLDNAPRSSEAHSSQEAKPSLDARDLGVNVDTSGILEGVDSGESAEGSGEVSEKASEGVGEHRQSSSGKFQQFQQQLSKEEAEALKLKILQSPPTRKQMVEQIRFHVHREIEQFQKRASQAEKQGRFRDLADAAAKMRELKGMLAQLLNATAEAVKNLWLKVVHGIV